MRLKAFSVSKGPIVITSNGLVLISDSYFFNIKSAEWLVVDLLHKKHRVSIWLLPVIAVIGLISAFAHLDGGPVKRKNRTQQTRSFEKTPDPAVDLFELSLLKDFDELPINAA